MRRVFVGTLSALALSTATASGAFAQTLSKSDPLVIREQGSFAIGGTVSKMAGTYNNNAPTAEGQSFHGHHAYGSYQVPSNPKPLPIVMLHGAYRSARSWETTPDGREGVQNIFLRRGFSTYLVDQPRRGQQHRGDDDRTDAIRPAVLRPVPPWQVAELL